MPLEVVTGTAALSGVESALAALTVWHPLVDVYIDVSTDPNLADAVFTLYAVTGTTSTRITGTVLSGPGVGRRILAQVPGEGATIEVHGQSKRGATSPITVAIIGYSTNDGAGPNNSTAAAGPLASGATATPIAALAWNPVVDAFVQGGAAAAGAEWSLLANIAGFGAAVIVDGGPYTDVNASTRVARVTGGASSWGLALAAVAGPMAAVTCALVGTQLQGIGGGSGPGGGGGGLAFQDDGVPVPGGAHTTLNVVGGGVQDSGGGLATYTPATKFNGGAPNNIQGNRTAGQSPIDNTKNGVVNLGSRSAGATAGATANFSTIGGGDKNIASGQFSCVAGGQLNVASGIGAFCAGEGCIASGQDSAALGAGQSTADLTFSAGGGVASATSAAALCTATASAIQACAVNAGTAGAQGCFAANQGTCPGPGTQATALGTSSATGNESLAHGNNAIASRQSQRSNASGQFLAAPTGNGTCQITELHMLGFTQGAGAGETVELTLLADSVADGGLQLFLENGKAYNVIVEAVAATPTGGRSTRGLVRKASVRQDGGVVTVDGQNALESYGAGGDASWTLDLVAGAGPARLIIRFGTGATTSAARVSAEVRMQEVAY